MKLKNPITFFDLETTGTNISNDRIIEAAFIKVLPDGTVEKKSMRINPGMHIPAETSMIHGIFDEDVKDAPSFKQVAKDLAKFLEGCDLSGFNIIRFDVPMLVEEFLRADVNFEVSSRKLIDAQKIFHLMEKRNLSAAYKFYCGKVLEDAHSADADTQATLEVLEAQVLRYEGQDVFDMQGNKLGVFTNDTDQLHQLTNDNMVDLAGRMVFNDKGEEVFNFGKHRGKRVSDILNAEPSYYEWMMRGDFPLDTKRRLTEVKLRQFNIK